MNPSSFVNDLTNKIVNYRDSDILAFLKLHFMQNQVKCDKCGHKAEHYQLEVDGWTAIHNNWIFTICENRYANVFCSQKCYCKYHQRSYNCELRGKCPVITILKE